MANLDPNYINESLQRLFAANVDIFGANDHRFQFNPPLSDAVVGEFERRHRVSLPSEYRHFITEIGNGGAGPYYGVFPLGQMDGLGNDFQAWQENDGFVGILSAPFPLSSSWNDLQAKPSDEDLEKDEERYGRELDQFASSLTNGALPICHGGCALRIWLVICGSQTGYLWRDARSEYGGLRPLRTAEDKPATFSAWYTEWLEAALRQLSE